MEIQAYQDLIKKTIVEIKDNPDYLKQLLEQIEADDTLSEDEYNALLVEIAEKNQSILGVAISENGTSELASRSDRLFPRYSFLDDALEDGLECGLKVHQRDEYEYYSHWLVEKYLPTFHPLPRPDLQYKVLACWMLTNAMAARPNTKFPILWIQGLAGVGKSELGKAMLMHYPESLTVNLRSEDTGASLRDRLDAKFGDGSPGIMLADNIWVKPFIERMGVFRSIILANCKADAVCHLSTKGDNSQGTYHTHCLKVFTSVDDGKEGATSDFSEIARRLWVITCKDTGSKPPSKDLFSWTAAQVEYQKYWGHEAKDKMQNEYGKIFAKAARTKADKIPFDMKIWEMLVPCLAVWEYVGLGTFDEGIEAFLKHREWTYSLDTANIDAVLQSIKGYFIDREKDIDNWLEKEKTSPFASRAGWLDKRRNEYENTIDPAHMKQYIERALDQKVSQPIFEKIVQIMTNYKYLYRVKDGKGIFVKE